MLKYNEHILSQNMSSIKQTFSCFNDDISKEVSEPIIDHKEISQTSYVNMLVHEKRAFLLLYQGLC